MLSWGREVGKHWAGLCLAVIATVAFGATPGVAIPVLDQDTTGAPAGDLFDDNDSTLYQVFTAGRTGTLDSIEIELVNAPNPGFTFTLARLDPSFDGTTSSILGASLASLRIDGAGAGLLSVDLSALGIAVQAGDAFVFRFEHDDFFAAKGATGYSGGNAWFECIRFRTCVDPLGPPGIIGPAPFIFFAVDEPGVGLRSLAFRTFLVPEPTGLMALAAVGGLWLVRRTGRS